MRIVALALGTGDPDYVYHGALHELQTTLASITHPDQQEMLDLLAKGHRLRDISDLPFDLIA